MSTEIHITCDGKTADEVARETTQTLDAFIAQDARRTKTRWALEQGIPPHVVDRQMREYRDQVHGCARPLARGAAGLAQSLARELAARIQLLSA